jgi:filamentous hemagglutinin family protein
MPRHIPSLLVSVRPANGPAVAGHRPLLLALAVAGCFGASSVQAQPSGAQAVHGTASLSQQGNTLVVTTQNGAGTAHSSINWQSFSVPAGSATQFNQPSATSTSINRVTGGNVSQIFGTLSSNGKLVLVNPAGIAIGAGAMVDTAGFTASTLRMSDADALAGRMRFGDGSLTGALSVDGSIVARGADIILIAPDVQVGSKAVIQSPDGATILVAGRRVEILARGLEGIRMELQAPTDRALNLGKLSGDAVAMFAGTLTHSGLINATAATAEGGKVVLKASGGDALVDGDVHAAGWGGKGRGGSIDVFGQRVALQAGAVLDASAIFGGGRIRVGGDFQGKNPDVPNAQRTYVDQAATLRADATVLGHGGQIIVWADDQTKSYGDISARGGIWGGNGGFVEVSGKRNLSFGSHVDTRAPRGKTGTLLLDPNNINVVSDSEVPTPLGQVDQFSDSGEDVPIYVGVINSAESNVVLQANNDINIDAPISMLYEGIGFTAQAGHFLNVNQSITTRGGPVVLRAGDSPDPPSESLLNINAAVDTTSDGSFARGAPVTLYSGRAGVDGRNIVINAPINAGSDGALTIAGQGIDIMGGVQMDARSISIVGSGPDGRVKFWAAPSPSPEPSPSPAPIRLNAAEGVVISSYESNVEFNDVQVSNNASGAGVGFEISAGGNIIGRGEGVELRSEGRDIALVANRAGDSFVATGSGSVDATSMGIYTFGTSIDGGRVSVTASGGIQLGTITTAGGTDASLGSGMAGGAVTLINSGTGAISVGDINTGGGNAAEGFSALAGNAGNVTVTANDGDIALSRVQANGGSGGSGGDGGVISVSRVLGDLRFTGYDISANGGSAAAAPGSAGNGGRGGGISIGAQAGALTMNSGEGDMVLSAIGGNGGTSRDSETAFTGGAGGAGGNVDLRAQGGNLSFINFSLSIDASGGYGGTGNAPGSVAAEGGAGGAGGSIQMQASVFDVTLSAGSSFLNAGGGGGGNAVCLEACAGTAPGGSGGAAGGIALGKNAGASTLNFGGATTLVLNAGAAGSDSQGNAGTSVPDGVVQLFAGTGGIAQSEGAALYGNPDRPGTLQLHVDTSGAVMLNDTGNQIGKLSGRAEAAINVEGVGNVGSLQTANGNITLTGYDPEFGRPIKLAGDVAAGGAGNVLLVTASTVTIAASGSATASRVELNAALVENSGTLVPGGAGAVGTLNVSGDLLMKAGSKLAIDFDGGSHDTIAVAGLTTFEAGTTVAANAIATPPPGAHAVVPGATGGSLPALSGNLAGASLRFGSLEVVVPAGAPLPAPAPPPVAANSVPAPASPPPSGTPTREPESFVLNFAQHWQQELRREDKRILGKDDVVLLGDQCVR